MNDRQSLVRNMRVCSVVVFCAVIACACASLRSDRQFWQDLAQNELYEALQVKWNLNTAKNVILFLGDGMGPNTITATRIYKGGESHRLVYEQFPHVGLLKTYSANKMVPDSACSATALFCGVKVNQDTVGVDASVKKKDCNRSLKTETHLQSLAAIALQAGKSAGLVTTMRVTHATPGPLYAHSADRKWECEDFMPPQASGCKDIARQLVEDWPGRDLNVIMGGGRDVLVSNKKETTDGIERSQWSCVRKDGRDLIAHYKRDKERRGLKCSIISNNNELLNLNVNKTDYLLASPVLPEGIARNECHPLSVCYEGPVIGDEPCAVHRAQSQTSRIFSNDHMKYEKERNKGPDGSPSLSEMVETAIKVLRRNKNGYFLMVEGGNVDMAHHRGWVRRAIEESAALEDAVQVAANLTDEADTLLIVTSDHTHTLNINGYPERGSDIFGIAQASPFDGTNYTKLSYTTGSSKAFQFSIKTEGNETKIVRREPTKEDISRPDYIPVAGIQLLEEAHGGGDVIIYARGPYSHLFHNVHEQHYVYHAISYAAKMGVFSKGTTTSLNVSQICLVILLSLLLKL